MLEFTQIYSYTTESLQFKNSINKKQQQTNKQTNKQKEVFTFPIIMLAWRRSLSLLNERHLPLVLHNEERKIANNAQGFIQDFRVGGE